MSKFAIHFSIFLVRVAWATATFLVFFAIDIVRLMALADDDDDGDSPMSRMGTATTAYGSREVVTTDEHGNAVGAVSGANISDWN